jgi:hypothetical protein
VKPQLAILAGTSYVDPIDRADWYRRADHAVPRRELTSERGRR